MYLKDNYHSTELVSTRPDQTIPFLEVIKGTRWL